MGKELERDLGLVAVVAVSMGAMIGSGIFILPGIAMAEAGPAVVVAFVIAAILVIPAGISIAELGTAMPEAGGDYVFIERGMGPTAGTIAGLGTWLMLMFKGALALFGGMFYINFVYSLPTNDLVLPVLGLVIDYPGLRGLGVGLAIALIAVNLIGVKQTGGLQAIMVVVMLVILSVFVAVSMIHVEGARFDGFFDEGAVGLFSATALVLVSYAGVTKIAAVAEEIENPGRNLPLGLLLSLFATAALYALLVFVLVGVVEGEQLADSNEPMALAVELLFGEFWFVVAIVVAAVLALVSTANAGILTASRYPLALSRDGLFLKRFEYIHPRFSTPTVSILVTGAVMIALVAALPVEDIAKTAGAFQILVYILVCIALIAFRERDLEWYDPDFESPLYPWLQLFGIVSGVFIITRMDLPQILGAIGIVIFGFVWYRWYASDRVDREGIAVDAARRTAGRRYLEQTEAQLAQTEQDQILVAIRRDVSRIEEDRLLRVVAPLARARNARIRVIRFDEVPDQYPLDQATGQSPADVEFEERTDELVADLEVPVEVGEIVSHDTKHAVVNYAKRVDVDLIVTRADPVSRLRTLFGRDADWIMERAPCDVVFFQQGAMADLEEIAVVTDRSPFNDPLKVELADAIASTVGATIRFYYAVGTDASESAIETIEAYHEELDDRCSVPVEGEVVRTDDTVEGLLETLAGADLVMLSTETHRRLPDLLFSPRSDRVATRLTQPVLLVHSHKSRRATFLQPIVDRILFRD